jgi:hypothetical protein
MFRGTEELVIRSSVVNRCLAGCGSHLTLSHGDDNILILIFAAGEAKSKKSFQTPYRYSIRHSAAVRTNFKFP